MSASNEKSPYDREWLARQMGRQMDRPPVHVHKFRVPLNAQDTACVVAHVREIALEFGDSVILSEKLADYLGPILQGTLCATLVNPGAPR